MNYLFVHQNFPGQYQHLVAHLVAQGHRVVFLTQANSNEMRGVEKLVYPGDARGPLTCHPYTVEFDRAVVVGLATADAARALRDQGFAPDLIVGHCGWGETLFLKDVFPGVPLLANFEFYYRSSNSDVDFDPEFASTFTDAARLQVRNATTLLAAQSADAGHVATRWQCELFPEHVRRKLTVLHEGVNTQRVRPDAKARLRVPGLRRALGAQDEVVTYVARNLEPYRGFHSFMRALPALLKKRPQAHVVIVGGDGVSYGAPPMPGMNFRQTLMEEVGAKLDPARVHFLGQVDYDTYLTVLQVSSAHVYLTYPFVLSWSFLEAMAAGCLIIGSDTAPVREVLQDGVNGLLVDFFKPAALARRLVQALEQRERWLPLRAAARASVMEHYDLHRVILPRWDALLERVRQRRIGVLPDVAAQNPAS